MVKVGKTHLRKIALTMTGVLADLRAGVSCSFWGCKITFVFVTCKRLGMLSLIVIGCVAADKAA